MKNESGNLDQLLHCAAPGKPNSPLPHDLFPVHPCTSEPITKNTTLHRQQKYSSASTHCMHRFSPQCKFEGVKSAETHPSRATRRERSANKPGPAWPSSFRHGHALKLSNSSSNCVWCQGKFRECPETDLQILEPQRIAPPLCRESAASALHARRFLLDRQAPQDLPKCSSRACVMAEFARIGSRIEADTSPSSRTRETASAPRLASRRPSAKVAMFTPSFPSVVPI